MTRPLSCGRAALLFSALVILGGAPTSAHELRASFSSECPTVNEPNAARNPQPEAIGAVAGAIGMVFVDKLVDAGIVALKKALVPEAKSLQAQFLIDGLYVAKAGRKQVPGASPIDDPTTKRVVPSPHLACLVMAIGEFGPSTPNSWNLPFPPDPERPDAVETLRTLLQLKAPPMFYFEAVRHFSPDGTAMTWLPVRFHVSEFLDSGFFAGSSRGFLVTVRLYKPSTSSPFASEVFSFNEVPNTLPYTKGVADLLQGNVGQWIAIPAPTERFAKADFPIDKEFDPFTLEVHIVQSPKPYQLAQMFAESVEAKTSDIKSAVATTLDPARADAAARTAETTTIKSINDFIAALIAANTACPTGLDTGDAIAVAKCNSTRAAARVAREAAQASCATASVEGCDTLPPVK